MIILPFPRGLHIFIQVSSPLRAAGGLPPFCGPDRCLSLFFFVLFFLFLRPFMCVFSALYCCVGEAQGRGEGWVWGGLAVPLGCMRKGGGDDSEWMFLGKERRRKPGWKWVVQKQPTNKQRTFFFFCYFHKSNSVLFFFCFFFHQIQFCSTSDLLG